MGSGPNDPPFSPPSTLAGRHGEHTRREIVTAAAELLSTAPLSSLTNAAVASHAGISERTVYRHFPTREVLLAALACEVAARIDAPPAPDSVDALPGYVRALYGRFEASAGLTAAALHADLFPAMRDGVAAQRWKALRTLLRRTFPTLPAATVEGASANLRYLLSATTWNYYRTQFSFDFERTVTAVELAVSMILTALRSQA